MAPWGLVGVIGHNGRELGVGRGIRQVGEVTARPSIDTSDTHQPQCCKEIFVVLHEVDLADCCQGLLLGKLGGSGLEPHALAPNSNGSAGDDDDMMAYAAGRGARQVKAWSEDKTKWRHIILAMSCAGGTLGWWLLFRYICLTQTVQRLHSLADTRQIADVQRALLYSDQA